MDNVNIKNEIKNRLLGELKENILFKNIPELSHRSLIVLFTLSGFDYGYDAKNNDIATLKESNNRLRILLIRCLQVDGNYLNNSLVNDIIKELKA